MGKRYKQRKSKTFIENVRLSNLYLLPIFLILAIVPLIVYAKLVSLDGLEALTWSSNSLYFDFFSYYKAILFVILIVINVIILIVLYRLRLINIQQSKYYPFFSVYIFFVVVSSIFADDIDVILRGFIEMHQGIFVLIGYILLMFLLINLVKETKHVVFLLVAIIFMGVIVGIIGVGQYFGYDIFTTEFGRLMILPAKYHSIRNEISFHFSKFAVYSTLYNTNFVGSFAALMIPLSFSLYIYQNKLRYAVISFVFVGLMIFVGFGSNSRAGIIGVIVALILILILFRNEIAKKPLFVILPFLLVVIVGYSLNVVSDGRILAEIKSLSLSDDIEKAQELQNQSITIEEMHFDDYKLTILTEKEDLYIEFINNDLIFSTINGDQLDVLKEGNKISILNDKYIDYLFIRNSDSPFYRITVYDKSFNLWLTIDGFKVEGANGELYIPSNPKRIKMLDGYESLFSNRVYIWSRSIPMLLDYPIVGAGPDMYAIAFPQDDFVGRLNALNINSIVEKPHNMYLQMGVNTGVISLIAMIIVFVMYITESINLYFKRSFKGFKEYIGVGLFASVFAYLVSGFFNDQIISVAPLFYGMLGLGIVINRLIRDEEKSPLK